MGIPYGFVPYVSKESMKIWYIIEFSWIVRVNFVNLYVTTNMCSWPELVIGKGPKMSSAINDQGSIAEKSLSSQCDQYCVPKLHMHDCHSAT